MGIFQFRRSQGGEQPPVVDQEAVQAKTLLLQGLKRRGLILLAVLVDNKKQ